MNPDTSDSISTRPAAPGIDLLRQRQPGGPVLRASLAAAVEEYDAQVVENGRLNAAIIECLREYWLSDAPFPADRMMQCLRNAGFELPGYAGTAYLVSEAAAVVANLKVGGASQRDFAAALAQELGDGSPESSPAMPAEPADAERGRWLIERGLKHANVELTDDEAGPIVILTMRFHLPEPVNLKYEDGDWTADDVRTAIDAARERTR